MSVTNTKTILVVDDEEDIQLVLSCILEKEGYATITLGNGEDAIRVLIRESIDLVISNIMMPKIDGLSLLRWVRDNKTKIPFIMLSAQAADVTIETAMNLGASIYITKPFVDVELVEAVRNVLGSK